MAEPAMTGVIQRPATSAAEQQVAGPILGAIRIKDGVLAKLVAYAASELRDIGGPPRGLGRLPGDGIVGGGKADVRSRPTVTAHVSGALAHLDLVMSVRWPAPVQQVAARLEQHLRDKVPRLTGLQVGEVRMHVADLITGTAAVARVH
jgi:uncharacterized alkaline shock family protein YloU